MLPAHWGAHSVRNAALPRQHLLSLVVQADTIAIRPFRRVPDEPYVHLG